MDFTLVPMTQKSEKYESDTEYQALVDFLMRAAPLCEPEEMVISSGMYCYTLLATATFMVPKVIYVTILDFPSRQFKSFFTLATSQIPGDDYQNNIRYQASKLLRYIRDLDIDFNCFYA